MILCPAQPFDIPAVMAIERSAFIPKIQEKRRVYEDRLSVFPQGFFVLADTAEDTVRKNGGALVAGCFTSELWAADALDSHDDKALAAQFALGHKIYRTHRRDGSLLYVSSFALLRQYRGRGLGKPFFRSALASLTGAFRQIQRVVLLADEEWEDARHIYASLGFAPVHTLPGLFPSLHRKAADGIVMTADADAFRSAALVTNENGAVVI